MVLTAITTSQVISLVRPLATAAGKSGGKRLWLPFQIASLAAKEVSAQGVKISKRQLRKLIRSAAVADLLQHPADDDDTERASTQIAGLVPGLDDEGQQRNAQVVVDAIFWGYLYALDRATAQAYTRLEDKVGQLRSAAIAERERMDVRVSFDEKLLRFPPVLRESPAHLPP